MADPMAIKSVMFHLAVVEIASRQDRQLFKLMDQISHIGHDYHDYVDVVAFGGATTCIQSRLTSLKAVKHFDVIVEHFQTELGEPFKFGRGTSYPQVFRWIQSSLPGRIIYFDASTYRIEAAQTAGIEAYKYQDHEQVRQLLETKGLRLTT